MAKEKEKEIGPHEWVTPAGPRPTRGSPSRILWGEAGRADFVPLGAVPPDICTGRMTLRLAIPRRVPRIEDVFGNSVRRIQVYDAYFRTHVPMQQVDACPRGLPLGPVGGFERGNKK